LFFLFVPLLIQVVLFGYAANFSVNHVSTVVLDLDRSQASRELVSHFEANGRFEIVDVAANEAQMTRDIDAGRAVVAIMIHAGFARGLANGKTAPLQVAVDGTNSNTALIALGYVSQIVAQFQADAMAKAWPVATGAAPSSIAVTMQERPWFNDELNDHWFFL
jgi:ABC-2 type transport system permease protein